MNKPDTRKLVCTACQHENEVERVYCHNCGEKLDRSLLPQFDGITSADAQAKTGRKVQRMMNPNRFAWARHIKTFVMLEVFAAVVAAGYLAVQAPHGTPPMKTDRSPDIIVADTWMQMMETRPAVSVTFKASDLNYYLGRDVKGATSLGIKFERAFVILKPARVTVVTQRDAWGLPIYNGVTVEPVRTGTKWGADVKGLSVGRLPIPASFGKLVRLDTLVQDAMTKAFQKQIGQLERVEKIESGDDTVTFVTKPAQ